MQFPTDRKALNVDWDINDILDQSDGAYYIDMDGSRIFWRKGPSREDSAQRQNSSEYANTKEAQIWLLNSFIELLLT